MKREELDNLLYEALETERGGVKLYEAALRAVQNEDLRAEWEEYLEQTRRHVQVLQDVFQSLGLDVERQTPGCKVVKTIGDALVQAIELARTSRPGEAAQVVAAECVVLAETKDHLNWELLGEAAKNLSGDEGDALADACEQVEDEEDEHLYHTTGWCRELHLQALGLDAVLPPPEEEKDARTAIEAAEAKQDREEML
jgi:ferritin-like metal-binding protein YciE